MFNGSDLKSRADGHGESNLKEARDHMTSTALSGQFLDSLSLNSVCCACCAFYL